MRVEKHIERDVARAKHQLIERYKSQGMVENFGQDVIRKLRDKYIEYSYDWRKLTAPIDSLDQWAMTFTGNVS